MTEEIMNSDGSRNWQANIFLDNVKRLEQENKELKEQNENIINEYNKLQAEIIGDMEFKELMLTGITPLKVLQNLKERNRELQAFYDVHESFKTDFDTNRKLLDNYRSALEEIRRICKCSKEPMNCDECPQCDDCEELCVNDENLQDIILDKINKVLQ